MKLLKFLVKNDPRTTHLGEFLKKPLDQKPPRPLGRYNCAGRYIFPPDDVQ